MNDSAITTSASLAVYNCTHLCSDLFLIEDTLVGSSDYGSRTKPPSRLNTDKASQELIGKKKADFNKLGLIALYSHFRIGPLGLSPKKNLTCETVVLARSIEIFARNSEINALDYREPSSTKTETPATSSQVKRTRGSLEKSEVKSGEPISPELVLKNISKRRVHVIRTNYANTVKVVVQ